MTFHSRKPIKYLRSFAGMMMKFKLLPNATRTAPLIVSIHQPTEPANDVFSLIVKMGCQTSFSLRIIQFDILNTPIKPCITEDDYYKCYNDCILKKYQKLNLSCRLPFYPTSLNLKQCKYHKNLMKEYEKVVTLLTRTDGVNDCSCKPRCTRFSYTASFEDLDIDYEYTTVKYFLDSDTYIHYKQKLAYTFIALICDMGGNIGLYSGLSILSMIQLLQSVTRIAKYCKKIWIKINNRTKANNYLMQKIKTIAKEEMQARSLVRPLHIAGFEYSFEKGCSLSHSIVWLIVMGTFMFGMFYIIYDRANHYLADPTSMIVDVVQNRSIWFPSLYFCGDSNLLKKKKGFFSTQNQGNGHCSVDMLDMLGEELKADELWSLSSLKEEIWANIDMGKETWGFQLISSDYSPNDFLSPYGMCLEYILAPELYSGTSTAFTTVFGVVDTCGNDTLWFFMGTPHLKIVEYGRGIQLATSTTSFLLLESNEYHNYNSARKPCSNDEYYQCQEECFQVQLEEAINCRLPFMHDEYLPVCHNPSEAKTTRREYLKAHMTDVVAHCNCKPRCSARIVEVTHITELQENGDDETSIIVTFQTNVVRHVIEIPVYGLIKLLCDLGGILGLVIGISVLSLFDAGHTIIVALGRWQNK